MGVAGLGGLDFVLVTIPEPFDGNPFVKLLDAPVISTTQHTVESPAAVSSSRR